MACQVVTSWRTREPVDEETFDTLSDEFDHEDWTVSARPDGDGVEVYAWADVESPLYAFDAVLPHLFKRLEHGGVQGELVDVRVRTEDEVDAELDQSTIPELLGAHEVAEFLSVRRQRVHQLATENPRFPAPLVRVAMGPLWDRRGIERFAREWERKPGRPRGTAVGNVRKAAALRPQKPVDAWVESYEHQKRA